MNPSNPNSNTKSGRKKNRSNLILWASVTAIVLIIIVAISENSTGNSTENKDKMTIFEVGQSFNVEGVEFLVKDVKKEKLGDEAQRITVEYSAKNMGKKEVTIYSDNVILVDFVDRIHKSELSTSSPGALNPGMKKDGTAEFEVPLAIGKAVVGFRADAFDFGGADYGYVKLP